MTQLKPLKKGEKKDRDEKGRFVKGKEPGPGRPIGVKNFVTIFEAAVKKIAKEKNIKECDVEIDLVIRAIAEARGGNYSYYKDIFDRIYGKAKESIELEGQIKAKFELTDEQFNQIIRRRAKNIGNN